MIAYSADNGVSWTVVADSTISTIRENLLYGLYIYAIAYGGGRWVVGGVNGHMAYSDD